MSQTPLPPSENDPLAAPSPALVRRRPATVQLRQGGPAGGAGDGGSPLGGTDQSTQALGDALRVVYRFLQLGMIVLVVVFLFSGLKSVKEGERGIRVALGKVEADDLTPGFHLSLPQPLGDVLKWVERLRPRRTILTHMGTDLDWAWMGANLPAGVEAGFDGMVLEFAG